MVYSADDRVLIKADMDMGQLFETQPNPTHSMLYTNPTQPISIYP